MMWKILTEKRYITRLYSADYFQNNKTNAAEEKEEQITNLANRVSKNVENIRQNY